jgi:hypothetical protein
MKNIYDLFNDRQEDIFDEEYRQIQESSDELLILEKATTVTLEQLVYNNPEKKKLSVLMEEVEASEAKKTNDIIEKLKEQMRKVLEWISRMFKHYDKLFAEGASFVKNNDLNQYMLKLKSKGNTTLVNCHPSKSTFQKMQTICLRGINVDRFVTKRMRGNSNSVGEMANEELQSGDKTDNYLQSLLKQFRMDKENLQEINLTKVNILVIHNNLSMLPEANKKLEKIKSKVQRMYNNAINEARDSAREKVYNRNTGNKPVKADNELAFINAQIKKINERIRAYAKIMTMVFNEDYNLAKLIVSKATGNESLMTGEKKKKGLFGKKDENKKEN